MTIKQDIPDGWVESKLNRGTIKHVGYEHRIIVIDWLFRNRHPEAIEAVIIPAEFAERDATIAAYYKRLGLVA